MMWSASNQLIDLLEEKHKQFNSPEFIDTDPISIPHLFTQKQDIEIAGLFASILAWGQRKTILKKCNELLERMDYAPYQFIQGAKDQDLKRLEGFVHRTFNDFDLLYTVSFLQEHYAKHESLESAFAGNKEDEHVRSHLSNFRKKFTKGESVRTGKHISTPDKKSACKRLNMYLRWMVREDDKGVDFGIWKEIKPYQLVLPCDVHVERVAKHLGLTDRIKPDWDMAIEITNRLKTIDPKDPARFDFALFGMGIEKYFTVSI
nr:TIGR02757 family protein [Leadbetterella byssophila]